MHEHAFGAAEQQSKLIRTAEIAASQIFRFYHQHALCRQGIVGNRHYPGTEHGADNLPELGTTVVCGSDDVCGHLVTNNSRFTCDQKRQGRGESNGVCISHYLPTHDPVLMPQRFGRIAIDSREVKTN